MILRRADRIAVGTRIVMDIDGVLQDRLSWRVDSVDRTPPVVNMHLTRGDTGGTLCLFSDDLVECLA